MSSTDNRIVKMTFDNAKFKQEALATQASLTKLDSSIAAAGKNKGLLNVSSGMQQVAVNASKMQVVATTALATITAKATSAGLSLAKSLAFDPIKQGFTEYEALLTKQNTIQNATGKSAAFVKSALNELNTYSDQTIYSFSNMTDSVTKFVNAGVSLPKSVETIKGIANAAAFAGATTEEANRAMYAFSQSMSMGFIGLQDWNQIENANMGTVRFKTELLKAAVAAGELTREGKEFVTTGGRYISATEGWRTGLQEQWATTEVLNAALSKYSDTNTKLGKQAAEAATEVRTFTAFMSTLKESLGSGWSKIFTSLFGNLNQATKFWTGLSQAIGGNITKFFDWLSAALKTWRAMGGFEKTLQGFKNLLAPIGAILDVIGTAIRAAFPNSGEGSGKALYAMSAGFEAITRPLQWLADLIRLLTGPMTLFFQIIRIGGAAVQEVAGYISDLVKSLFGLVDLKAPDSGGFLGWIRDLGSAIADTVGQVTKLLNKGKSLGEAFKKVDLPDLPGLPSIGNPFSGAGGDAADGVQEASASFGGLSIPLGGLSKVLEKVGDGFKWFGNLASEAGKDAADAGEFVANLFKGLWEGLGKILNMVTFQDVLKGFNFAIFTTFMITITRMIWTLTSTFETFMGRAGAVNQIINSVTGALGSLQTTARAKLITAIAIAIGVLAVSLWLLSKIPMMDLAKGLLAMSGIMFILNKSLKEMGDVIAKMDQDKMSLKLIAFSVAVTALAFSMLLLATAMLIMNKVEWQSIAKGLIVMTVLMSLMQKIGNMGTLAAKNMFAAGVAIMLISQSMLMLAAALVAFQFVEWESIAKAGVVLGGLALAVGLLALIPYDGIAKVGLALLAASTGISMLSVALIIFGKVKWSSIGKAAVTLGILTLALGALMFVGNPVSIAGIVSMSAAMIGLAIAGRILNNVEWSSIGKIALIMGVLILAFGAFLAVITFFAPALIIMSAFAGSLALLALALTGLALAFALVFPLLAAGTGVFAAFATGAAVAIAVFLQTLAAEAPIMKKAFLDILQTLIDTIVEAVPMVIQGIKDLFAAILAEFSSSDNKNATKKAGGDATKNLAQGFIEKIPTIVKVGVDFIVAFLKGLKARAANLAAAGAGLIVEFINGLGRKAKDIVDAGFNLVEKVAEGISDGLADLIRTGVQLIADFLHALANIIRYDTGKIGDGLKDVVDAFYDLGVDMIEGLINGVKSKIEDFFGMLGDMADKAVGIVGDILETGSPSRVFMRLGQWLVDGLTIGVQNHAASAVSAVAATVTGQIAVANEYINNFIQDLDQKALAARAKAEGLAAAAERAAQAANKTKSKSDDKAANQIKKRSEQADREAERAEKQAERAKERQDRQEAFEDATLIEKARMRSEDAQKELDAAKSAEQRAEKARIQAAALDRQSRVKGVTAEQRRKLQKEADALRAQAVRDAKLANKNLEDARKAAADAMKYQKLAGAEAAASFQEAFDTDAREAAEAAEFEKMTNAEKAALRRQQAAELQAKSIADLEAAKKLAYTDIQAANDLAALAMAEAERARQYLQEANDLGSAGAQGLGTALGTVVDLTPTDAAALGMSDYSDLYDSATAAAAAGQTNTFNQYNTSPEALSPTEIYRQSNNLFSFAVEKIEEATST